LRVERGPRAEEKSQGMTQFQRRSKIDGVQVRISGVEKLLRGAEVPNAAAPAQRLG